jgi:anaerobic C4-dicarboxylate transporter
VAWRGQYPDPQQADVEGSTKTTPALTGEALFNARGSTFLFLAGIVAVVLIGIFPDLRPVYSVVTDAGTERDQIDMGFAIMIVMFAIAGLIMIFFKASPEATIKGTIMHSGVVAIICIIGVSWLGSSFFEANRAEIVAAISGVIFKYPSSFAVGLFLLSSVLFSGAATIAILVPVGLALELPTRYLLAFYPAANSVFFLPTYGSVLAAVSFDRTGSTRIGKYLLNHSFMLPGLVTVTSAIVIGLMLSAILSK